MPGTIWKGTYFFEDTQSAAGWTENFYVPAINLNDATVKFNDAAYINARLTLMPPAYSLVATRVTNPDQPGLSTITPFPSGAAVGLYPTPGTLALDPAEEVYDALLVRMTTVTGIRRMFLMRGLPTGVITKTSGYANPAPWQPLFASWVGQIAAVGFVIYNRVKTGPFVLTSVLLSPSNRAISLTFAGGLPAGVTPVSTFQAPLIRLAGVTGANPINHNWRIQSVAVVPGTAQTFPGRREIFGVPNGVGANVFVLAPGGSSINTIAPLRGVKRNTGRPFGLLRGRQTRRG